MKTYDPDVIAMVKNLAMLSQARKDAEQSEKELKERIKRKMGSELVLEAGGWVVVISQRTRKDLDKEAISHDHGMDFLKQYTKNTTYDVLELKPVIRAIVLDEASNE